MFNIYKLNFESLLSINLLLLQYYLFTYVCVHYCRHILFFCYWNSFSTNKDIIVAVYICTNQHVPCFFKSCRYSTHFIQIYIIIIININ